MVELMIALGIVAVFSTVGLPSMTVFINEARVSSAANDLVNDLLLARSMAITLNCDVRIVQTTGTADWASGWGVQYQAKIAAADASCGDSAAALSQRTVTLKTRSTLGANVTASGPAASLMFTYEGRMADTVNSPAVNFSSSASPEVLNKCIELDPSGRPRQKSGADSNSTRTDGC